MSSRACQAARALRASSITWWESSVFTFPDGFLWGATSSAYQVEGGNFNSDWWRWEQRPGRIRDRQSAHTAARFAETFESDFDLARKLGHAGHLFSIEWSRVQPEPGRFDHDELTHYAAVADALTRRGLEPVCALNHVSLPDWFARRGGWQHREAPEVFGHFASRIAETLAGHVKRWIPILEPEHLVTMAWLDGQWPPGGGSFWNVYTVLLNLIKSHSAAYRAIHRLQPEAEVGLSVRARRCRPSNAASAWDLRAANRENHRSLELLAGAVCGGRAEFPFHNARNVAGTADFIALSYYGAETERWTLGRPLRFFRALTDETGRPVRHGVYRTDSPGFKEVLHRARTFGKPILIAGNGIDTADDTQRCRFLLDHISALEDAMRDGADVRGYFHRSLLDSFEWTDGYTSRYGLVHVDWETLGRTPNPSAYLFKDICESNTIRPGAVDRFASGWSRSGETI